MCEELAADVARRMDEACVGVMRQAGLAPELLSPAERQRLVLDFVCRGPRWQELHAAERAREERIRAEERARMPKSRRGRPRKGGV